MEPAVQVAILLGAVALASFILFCYSWWRLRAEREMWELYQQDTDAALEMVREDIEEFTTLLSYLQQNPGFLLATTEKRPGEEMRVAVVVSVGARRFKFESLEVAALVGLFLDMASASRQN